MRKPLSPMQAFAEDTRSATARDVDIGAAIVVWLSVAQTADQLTSRNVKTRERAMDSVGTVLKAYADGRPTMRHDLQPPPTDALAQVAERFRVAAEAMEQAGCFELAFTTVAAICRFTEKADYVTSALATVHLGRIARQMNDLSTAHDCYMQMWNTAMRERDGPLAARAKIGLALIHDMNGNLPAAEREYLAALALAVPNRATYASACQGLMDISISRGKLADALLYGWQLYDATENDFDARTSAVSELSVVALRGGFYRAALQGFEHALTLSQVPRIRLVALSGAMRALARLGNEERVRFLDAEVMAAIAQANFPHVAAMVLLHAAEAWAVVAQLATARTRLNQGLALAEQFGFHEYVFKAEALAAHWTRVEGTKIPMVEQLLEAGYVGDVPSLACEVGIHRLSLLTT